jgi:ribosomal protein S18 acetylase RimI-like enzyme
MSIIIRPMIPADAPAARELILGVAARLFQADATEVFIARHGHTLEDVDDFQRDYSPPGGLFLVALDGGRLIGTGAIRRIDDETAELRRMWLLEPYQGRGIGYRLWLALRAFAMSAAYRRIRLTTDEENVRALRFYRRLGFTPVAPSGDGQEINLEKELDDDNSG